MDQKQSLLIKKTIDLLLRKRAVIIGLVLLSMPIGLGVYLKTPKVYQSSTLLSYQQQKINPNKLSPDVMTQIRDIVSTITQIATSQTNLEKLIKNFGLYPEAVQYRPMEDVVEMMRRDISINPSRQGDTFRITYFGKDPAQVVKVANALAARFIEENLKYREERAAETSTYTNQELEMAKSVMDEKEAAMRDYKLKHFNEMSDQRVSNVSRLISLQEQYQKKQESILELERTKVLIQDQMSFRKKMINSEPTAAKSPENPIPAEGPSGGDRAEQIDKLRSHLSYLLGRYTENHPEVKRIKKMLAQVEAEELANPTVVVSPNQGSPVALSGAPSKTSSLDRTNVELESQLKNISLSIASIEQEMAELRKTISQFEGWVAAAPVREAEWSSLTREYGELKKHYDLLVAQNLQAISNLNLERRQKGSQFKIEDPAQYSEKPVRPDFIKIMALAIAAGAGLGFGYAFVTSYFDQSFRQLGEIEDFLNVPVVCTIAYIETSQEILQKKRRFVIGLVVLLVASLLIAGLFYFTWSRGKIII